jgi:hypothetical protein
MGYPRSTKTYFNILKRLSLPVRPRYDIQHLNGYPRQKQVNEHIKKSMIAYRIPEIEALLDSELAVHEALDRLKEAREKIWASVC